MKARRRLGEQDVEESQPEERDVAKPDQPATERGVAAQPVIALKAQPEREARDETEQDPDPTERLVGQGGPRSHPETLLAVTPDTRLAACFDAGVEPLLERGQLLGQFVRQSWPNCR